MLCGALFVAAVTALLAWSYGPGLSISESVLKEAYEGKTVLVCGASYGIGAEIAYGFARAHARIVITARSKDKLEAVAKRCRDLGAQDVVVYAADLSTKQGCRGLVNATISACGGLLDVLVLNHIIGVYEDWSARIIRGHASGELEADLDFVHKMFQVNALSYIYISSYALPALAKTGGRIIAVGSAAGRNGLPRVAPYSASKAAVFGYFDSLRQDLVASPDASLQSVSVTTGVLGSFNTETAREVSKGLIGEGMVAWHPPEEAAHALIGAGARRWRTVYVPWSQTGIATLLHPLMPSAVEWIIRVGLLSGEGKST